MDYKNSVCIDECVWFFFLNPELFYDYVTVSCKISFHLVINLMFTAKKGLYVWHLVTRWLKTQVF